MPENEYLKLLGNKVFWGFIAFSVAFILTIAGFSIGIMNKMDNLAFEVKSLKQDINYSRALDSIRQVARTQQQGNVDMGQNDRLRRLEAVR